MIALALEDMLTSLGCIVAGRASRLMHAFTIAESTEFDVAVLDVNLLGDRVDPLAEALRTRGIPFVFATGYGEDGVGERLRSAPIVHKPYDEPELTRALLAACAG